MVQAALAAVPGLLGNQTRRVTTRPHMPESAALVAQARDLKQAKLIAKQSKDDRLLYLLSQPEFVSLVILIGGIYASQNIPFTDNAASNEGLQAIATMGSVLIALGYAGVGDLTTLLAAAIAGGVSLTDFLSSGDNANWFQYFSPFNWLIGQVT